MTDRRCVLPGRCVLVLNELEMHFNRPLALNEISLIDGYNTPVIRGEHRKTEKVIK